MANKEKEIKKEIKRKPTITFYADPIMVEYVFAEVKKRDMNVSQFLRQLIREYHNDQIANPELVSAEEVNA